jgi:GTPase
LIDKKQLLSLEEKAVLVGLVTKDQKEVQVMEYLDELAFLAETAGAITVKRFIQKLPHPDSKTYIGK